MTRNGRAPSIGEVGDRADVIRRLIDRAKRSIPFYRDHLGGRTTPSLDHVPPFTKADLAGYGPFPLSSGSLGASYRCAATSGTTGSRLHVAYSTGDWQAIRAQLGHRAAQVGFGPGDVLLNTHGYGLWIGGPALDLLADACGCALVPSGPTGTSQLFEWMAHHPITGISATPSYVRLLLEAADAVGVDPSRWPLRVGFIGGEPISTPLRTQLSSMLPAGFIWQEMYGSTETGGPVVGYSPPSDPFVGQLNIDTDEFVVELLDPNSDEPVAPGEPGEITLTTTNRESTPLLRYRTRDLAVAMPDDVRDDSGFPRVSSIIGRIDDALKVRGALLYPSDVEEVLIAWLPHGAEWRVEITREHGAMDTITIHLEHDDEQSASRLTHLTHLLHQRIQVRPIVKVVPPGTLERFPGKARRVVDKRPTEEPLRG